MVNFNCFLKTLAKSKDSPQQREFTAPMNDKAHPSLNTIIELRFPYVEIIEQPARVRFRYESEDRSAGSIPGVSSTPERKTYPAIQIHNYTGHVRIVVSTVTKEHPHRAHPHNLVSREPCNHRGVLLINTSVTPTANVLHFKYLGIKCVKKRNVVDALRLRQELGVDPFLSGFAHIEHPESIDLSAVRLCFQVTLVDPAGSRHALMPLVSDVIHDKKPVTDLRIIRTNQDSGSARGGTQIIIRCKKLPPDETAVVFYLEQNNVLVWEKVVKSTVVDQQLVTVKTPPFRDPYITETVIVCLQLKRVKDNARSNSVPFEYIPDRSVIVRVRKPLPDLYPLSSHSAKKKKQALAAMNRARHKPAPAPATTSPTTTTDMSQTVIDLRSFHPVPSLFQH